jgi:VWFA-related protein
MKTRVAILTLIMIAASSVIFGQKIERELKLSDGQTLEVVNRFGRVDIISQTPAETETVDKAKQPAGTLSVTSSGEITEKEIIVDAAKGNFRIEVKPSSLSKRVDLTLIVPERLKLNIETRDGEIKVEGNFAAIKATTDTGTIAVDVPTEDLTYDLWWTTSKPRVLADFAVEEVKEKSAGRFQLKGRVGIKTPKKKKKKSASADRSEPPASAGGEVSQPETTSTDPDSNVPKTIALNFTTARGIVLLNVPPNEVMSDLRERPLTDAAKAVVRSGDADLVEAIRRASPKFFGDYAKTLPPARLVPTLTTFQRAEDVAGSGVRTVSVRVLDEKNRAVAGIKDAEFEITESGTAREIVSVKPSTAPFNLVLLLDVSGSVDTYVNFIRKAARNFVNTVDANDRVSIVLFNDDVKVLSGFTTDKAKLSEVLDTFDAGGGTAYYDALGYTLIETLRPMSGERTAIVVLTDGDDNRSFLPFDALAGTIEESGALIYPLYVPSSLAALGATQDLNAAVDPLRSKYLNLSLTSKAKGEGARLAQISGGRYYPITQLSQIQTAYEDIVVQLRTAYDITFKSEIALTNGKTSPRLKVRSKRANTYTQLNGIR